MTDECFEALRPKLFGVAYRMLGEVGGAEDAVQEAYLRWHRETSEGRTEIDRLPRGVSRHRRHEDLHRRAAERPGAA